MPVRHGDKAAGPFALTDLTEEAVRGSKLVELPEYSFIDRDVDDLPKAGLCLVAKREQDANQSIEAGKVITERGRAGTTGVSPGKPAR